MIGINKNPTNQMLSYLAVRVGESRLKKKHEKGDVSFENLMETLKFRRKLINVRLE